MAVFPWHAMYSGWSRECLQSFRREGIFVILLSWLLLHFQEFIDFLRLVLCCTVSSKAQSNNLIQLGLRRVEGRAHYPLSFELCTTCPRGFLGYPKKEKKGLLKHHLRVLYLSPPQTWRLIGFNENNIAKRLKGNQILIGNSRGFSQDLISEYSDFLLSYFPILIYPVNVSTRKWKILNLSLFIWLLSCGSYSKTC